MNHSLAIDSEDSEKIYLSKIFTLIESSSVNAHSVTDRDTLTPKVLTLLSFLDREDPARFSGLIFVKTRAEVAVLSHILSIHNPSFTIGASVGASSFSGHWDAVAELADVSNQQDALDDLRYGRKNLVVTTNALEEGM